MFYPFGNRNPFPLGAEEPTASARMLAVAAAAAMGAGFAAGRELAWHAEQGELMQKLVVGGGAQLAAAATAGGAALAAQQAVAVAAAADSQRKSEVGEEQCSVLCGDLADFHEISLTMVALPKHKIWVEFIFLRRNTSVRGVHLCSICPAYFYAIVLGATQVLAGTHPNSRGQHLYILLDGTYK